MKQIWRRVYLPRAPSRRTGSSRKTFKFGGKPSPPQAAPAAVDQPLTLSNILPPPSHVRLTSQSSEIEQDSVLNSILAQATEIPSAGNRTRLESDSSSKRGAREAANASWNTKHARQESALSFAGFDSFAEVRRGFEFTDDRPSFYPPAATRRRHYPQTSAVSMASFLSQSSYDQVINPGSSDPFDYGERRRLPGIPQSEDDCSTSISMSVDDTFSFICRESRESVRKRGWQRCLKFLLPSS